MNSGSNPSAARTDMTSPAMAAKEAIAKDSASAGDMRVTPMMAQYIEIKAANPGCLLFYRMGDFYELFFEDAEIASRCLGIVLTKRGKHQGDDIPMCGVPVERSDEYLHRLIAAGHRVAVCEQVEDPAEAKKRGAKSVVKRDVVRLVTPGTITEERLLDPARANLLCAVARVRAGDDEWDYALACADISTGRVRLISTDRGRLAADIARLDPRELLIPDSLVDDPAFAALWQECRAAVTPLARDGLDSTQAEKRILAFYGLQTLDGFGRFTRCETVALAAVLLYIERTQFGAKPALSPPQRDGQGDIVLIDPATRGNLELTRTLSGERQGSILADLDRTRTPQGGRLLAEWIASPLTIADLIHQRADAVAFLVDDRALRSLVRGELARLPDIARALGRIAVGRSGPRDLAVLRDGALASARIKTHFSSVSCPALLQSMVARLDALDETLADQLSVALADELPLQRRDGNFIRSAYDRELDETRSLRDDSRKIVAQLQAHYAETTGIKNLRIKHNNFLGYFVEVPLQAGETLRADPVFIHRQTMQEAMRFSTTELAALETKIASAADRALAIEHHIFDQLSAEAMAHAETLKAVADALAVLDVIAALAERADEGRWTRPHIDDSLAFHIEGGRHPVVETALHKAGDNFVANGTFLSPPEGQDTGRIGLITGPNMAGKSTYLRQNAVIALLAQMGSFVPADRAHIGIVDRLFSRVGAADDLARGRSTFMVEMVETAAILNQATARSFVILDEIGRGTATFDGLSIAWAAIEYLHETNGCRTLFATHYHELTALAGRLARLVNLTMRVKEWNGDVIFLHEVIEGTADRSYGIQVARLAGLPSAVITRARMILAELEATQRQAPVEKMIDDLPLFSALAARPQPMVAALPPDEHKDEMRSLLDETNPDLLSPREALDLVYRLKSIVK
jgi:DNA mismatch repair protein MutS